MKAYEGNSLYGIAVQLNGNILAPTMVKSINSPLCFCLFKGRGLPLLVLLIHKIHRLGIAHNSIFPSYSVSAVPAAFNSVSQLFLSL